MLSSCAIRAVVMFRRVVSRQFAGILFSAVVFLIFCGSARAQTPNLVYSKSLSATNETGNNFEIQYGGSMGTGTLAGNLLTLRMTYPDGSTVSSIVDNMSSTYTLGVTTGSGTGGWVTSLYYVPGAAAGITQITVTFSAAINDWHGAVQEYSGVAASSPGDGSCSSDNTAPPTVQCAAAIVTGASGDLIVASTMLVSGLGSSLCGNTSTSIGPGSSFILDAADLYCSDADEELVQSSSGSITPSFSIAGNSDTFNIAAMAFKPSPGAGTNPTGMYILHQQTARIAEGPASQVNYFVSSGNLLVASVDDGNTNSGGNIVTIDSCTPSNTWTKRTPAGGDMPQMFFVPSASTSTNMSCTVHSGQSGDTTLIVIYDIVGAASSPEDVDSTGFSGSGASIVDAPDLTPTTEPGIAFAVENTGDGPSTAVGAGYIYDNTPYAGETDSSKLNNGDGWQHASYTSASQLAFSWTQANSASYMWAFAIAFKSASIGLSADVGIAQSASPSSVSAGSNVTYTLTVTNGGPASASSVAVTDNLQSGTTYVSCSSSAGSCSISGNSVTVNIGTLASGATATVTLVASVNSATAGGTTITNSASVSSADSDPNSGNNTATATTTVSNPTDLSITNNVTPNPVVVGSNVTYTLIDTNNGPYAAEEVVVSDSLPVGTTFVSCSAPSGWSCANSSGNVTASVATLSNAASATITVVANVGASVANGTLISDAASVSALNPDPNMGNNSATSSTTVQNGGKTVPTITWATPAAITYGTALGSTQLDATASVAGSFSYTPAAGTVLGAGSQTLSVTFTPTDTTDYNSATASVTLQVHQATPTITWATPAAITYGTALSSTQLDATASVAGSFSYTPAAGTVLGVGSHTLSVTFTPTDTTDYSSASASVTLQVNNNNKATPTITWPAPAAITYGAALSSKQLDATASVAGSFSYTPAAGTVLGIGSHALSVTFTPTDTTDYSSASASVTLQVNNNNPATPTITWPTPAAITYGTALSSIQLDATASVAGSFSYTPTAGTVLSAGSHTLSMTFTPADTTDYSSATASVTLQVNKVAPTITWATPAAITYGAALSSIQLDATASVAGSFSYTPAAGTVLGAGSQTLSVNFTPYNTSNYSRATLSVTLLVNKATPTITWPTPRSITRGTPLSSRQLDATASVPGTLLYNPAAGTVLSRGSHTLSVTFTPADGTDYNSATATVTLQVY